MCTDSLDSSCTMWKPKSVTRTIETKSPRCKQNRPGNFKLSINIKGGRFFSADMPSNAMLYTERYVL